MKHKFWWAHVWKQKLVLLIHFHLCDFDTTQWFAPFNDINIWSLEYGCTEIIKKGAWD